MHRHQQLAIDETGPLLHRRPSLVLRRFLVIALYLSFFACLAALWLSGTLLGNPDDTFLPAWLLQGMATHRLFVLIVPFVSLVACYGAVRHITGEIMAVPERYLDERQRMVRDQAHRSAFKIIKLACLFIPALLLVQYIPWLHRASPTLQLNSFVQGRMFTDYVATIVRADASAHALKPQPALYFIVTPHTLASPVQQVVSASSIEIACAGGMLVLCLLVLISAVPMSVLAWKRQY
jgi:hypothetical protein